MEPVPAIESVESTPKAKLVQKMLSSDNATIITEKKDATPSRKNENAASYSSNYFASSINP